MCGDADADVVMQAYGAGQFYPGMPGGRFAPPQQQPAAAGYPAAGGYGSYAPPAAAGQPLHLLHAYAALAPLIIDRKQLDLLATCLCHAEFGHVQYQQGGLIFGLCILALQ